LLSSLERPFFLAGGLTPENVGEAIRRLRPMAVDTSSGVETDGAKDYGKMKQFIETVRSLEAWYSG
ncbi:MAG: phosphoribosylanthranilate isomerase, partial [Lawsonibacter sp.]|nr:phosphoribosylanthranilate isomerase [Lawsonibacter sp.]